MNLFNLIRYMEHLTDKFVHMRSEAAPIHCIVVWNGCRIGYIDAFEHEVLQVVKYVEAA